MGTGVTSLPSSLDYVRPSIHGVLLRQLLSFNQSRTKVRSFNHSFASLYYLCLEALMAFNTLCIKARFLESVVLSKLDKRFIECFKHFWLSPRSISIRQLHVSPHFHLEPIYLIVFEGSYLLA